MRAKALLPGLMLLAALAFLGCETAASSPSLLSVTGYTPTDLELGDEFEITGNGFPEGRSARVAFRGDLYRAGSKIEQGVEIVAKSGTSSPRSLSVAMTPQLRASFTGAEDDAKHTTFRGDVEVSFAPKKAGTAPVLGVITGVVLDVQAPLVSPTLQKQRDKSTEEALTFLGLELDDAQLDGCCRVASVRGRAAASGLRPGDKIVDFDGVTVKSKWDLVPSTSRRTSRLSYRHAGTGPIVTRELDVQGYRSAVPSELGPAVVILGFSLVMLLLHTTRLGRPLAWLVKWLSVRLREPQSPRKGSESSRSRLFGWIRTHWLGLPEEPGLRLLAVLFLVIACAIAMAIALEVEVISRELDLPLWCLSQTLSVVWGTVLLMTARRYGILASVRAAATVLLLQLPMLLLLSLSVVSAQSFRIADLVARQAPFLVGFQAFRGPAQLLLTGLSLYALLPAVVAEREGKAETAGQSSKESGFFALLLGLGRVLLGTVHLWSTALLLAVTAFGGYSVPGLPPSAQSGSLVWQCIGVLVLGAKTVGLVFVAKGIVHLAGDISFRDSLRQGLFTTLALAGLAVALAAIEIALGRRFALGWLLDCTATTLVLSTFAALALAVYRAARQARLPRGELAPNPWI